MNLIKSAYTIIHRTEDGILLYNTKNGAQIFVDKNENDILKEVKMLDSNQCNCITNEIFLKLFCVDQTINEVNEVMALYYKNMFDPTNLSFIIMPNNYCNFQCVYCYQDHDKKHISDEILEKYIEAIKDYYHFHGIKNFYIEWFGGEPLLSFKAIQKVTDELTQFFDNQTGNVEYHFGATTNGSLLSMDRVRYLLNHRFDFFQITLDGAKNNHNRTRPYANGEGTWDKIFENLLLMQSFDVDFHVSIRVNYNEDTLEDINELFEAISNKLDERFTIFFHSIGKWGGENDSNLKIIENELIPYVQKMLMDQAIKYNIEPRENYKFLDPFMRVCYAGKPYNFTLGTDGKLRKCNEENKGTDDFNIVGTIENGILELDIAKWAKFVLPGGAYRLPEKCGECKYLPICYGQNCPKNRASDQGVDCPHDFEIMSEMILNKYRYFRNKKS